MSAPLRILQSHFGFLSFRHHQELVIQSIIDGRDVLALMPTGGGKSLCYQIPALILPGLTIVISPLIALMKDQVDALKAKGIKAAFLNSTQSIKEQRAIFNSIGTGELQILYLAPERLLGRELGFLDYLQRLNISLFAIDEAHCISSWGHDFRPDYLQLSYLKKHFPKTPIAAFTATADKSTRFDIIEKLGMKDPAVFISSFNRENITIRVKPKTNSYNQILEFLLQHPEGPGIIYCLSRAGTEKLADFLNENGFQALPYHAGLDSETRRKRQEAFLQDRVPFMVATVAFGMGIDKSNVRFVVHIDLPKNLESYYQEIGRAGRDSLPGEVMLLYAQKDAMKLQKFIDEVDDAGQRKILRLKLRKMVQFCEVESCRRRFLLKYFDESSDDYCGNCDVCLNRYDEVDASAETRLALTAVTNLREQFGLGYLVDLLMGSGSAKIRDHHRELDVFGAGKNQNRTYWKNCFQDLVRQGILEQTKGMYPLVKMTSAGWEILKGKRNISLRINRSEKSQPHQSLLNELKMQRLEIAESLRISAAELLSNGTLAELCQYLPQTAADLNLISGFGSALARQHGDSFLETIRNYCRKNNLVSRMNSLKRKAGTQAKSASETKSASLELFLKGKKISEIAISRNLMEDTICGHLAWYIEKGELEVMAIMTSGAVEQIENKISNIGYTSLKQLKSALDHRYSYGEIRLVLAHLKRRKSSRTAVPR